MDERGEFSITPAETGQTSSTPVFARQFPRRDFLRLSVLAGGGFAIGLARPSSAAIMTGNAAPMPLSAESAITAWIRITPDNRITIIVSQAELGQGISTTLPAVLANELGADWQTLTLKTAPFSSQAVEYRNPKYHWMFTGNSESIQNFYDLMRATGAAAREMLTDVAARRWGVSPETCQAAASRVTHRATGRFFSFGELAREAATLPLPDHPTLRSSSGTTRRVPIPKVDIPDKVDGSAIFGIDIRVPDMWLAAIRMPPAIGGRLLSFDRNAISALAGVRAVVPVENGLAVVADTYWQARTALNAGKLLFDSGSNAMLDTASLQQQYDRALDQGPWATALENGKEPESTGKPLRSISADYHNPFLAHATMEPMNCTASVTDDHCEIWAPTQGQEMAFLAVKGVLGFRDDQIVINRSPYLGGGFGRRLLPDFVVQAALVSKAVKHPVKLIWDREEDLRHDYFRPASEVRLIATLDAQGMPTSLRARVVSPTILLPVFPTIEPVLREKGIDPSALEGMLETVYEIPYRHVKFHLLKIPVPTSVMRTTGYGPNIFALESFVDELAYAAKIDPYLYRRRLLKDNARVLTVLDRAAKLANWHSRLPEGEGRGIAVAHAFGTVIAQVINVEAQGHTIRVKKIVSVVDCGEVLDSGIATNNIEGGSIFGLSYCKSEITFKAGAVEQDNFNTYEMPYLSEAPELVTEFVDSGAAFGGVGEVSPVTVPPALSNAIYATTGRRLRRMPLSHHGLQFA